MSSPLRTLEEMEQAIRRGSRGRKPTKAVTFDEAEEPAEPPKALVGSTTELAWPRQFSCSSGQVSAIYRMCPQPAVRPGRPEHSVCAGLRPFA